MNLGIRIVCFMFCAVLATSIPVRVSADIFMSEVYPAPATGSEWIELCNGSTEPINLAHYALYDSSGKQLHVPAITIQPEQYILATASSILNNSGDSVYLRKDGIIIETMEYTTSLTASQSLISCNGAWSVTKDITPGFANTACETPTSPPIPTTINTSPTPAATVSPASAAASTTRDTTPAVLGESSASILPPLTPLSFTRKHAPRRTPVPTTSPTGKPTIAPIPVDPPEMVAWKTLGISFLIISLLSSGYLAYRVVVKMKESYNGGHDP